MLTFLKLGGSLITEKDQPHVHRPEVLARLADEIASAHAQQPDHKLLLGHGSGSFGHAEAHKHGTPNGVRTPGEWLGFAEVWAAASELNVLVARALREAGLPVISFQPSASARARRGRLIELAVEPILAALDHDLTPLVHGDVALDDALGGTIISTEDIFFFLAHHTQPARILLAGVESGVYSDYPAGRTVIQEITPANFETLRPALLGSASTDVTGGMATKVGKMLELCTRWPGLEVRIFSGLEPGNLRAALTGAATGTSINS